MDGPTRQERAAATRGHLLASARGLFAERGYRGTSVAAITDAAATAHGTFYLYFRNKDDVFGVVLTELLDDLYRHSFVPFEELGDHFDVEQNRERIAAFVGVFAADAGLWRAVLEAVLASPAVEAQWLAHRSRFHDDLAARLRRFQALGALRPFDAGGVALALGGMLEWYVFSGVVFASPDPLIASDDVVDLLSDLWVRALGLVVPPRPPNGRLAHRFVPPAP